MDSTILTEISTFSSPLDHVLRHVPKSHEKALRQAVYNILIAAVFAGVAFAGYYVFVVLEPFVIPMFWAVLSGFAIHPYKTRLAESLRKNLVSLADSERPSSLLVLESAFYTVDKALHGVGGHVLASWKVIFVLLAGSSCWYFFTAFLSLESLLYYPAKLSHLAFKLVFLLERLRLVDVCLVFSIHLTAVLMFWNSPQFTSSGQKIMLRLMAGGCWALLLGYLLNSFVAPVICLIMAVALIHKVASAMLPLAFTLGTTPDPGKKKKSEKPKPSLRRVVFTMLKKLQNPTPTNVAKESTIPEENAPETIVEAVEEVDAGPPTNDVLSENPISQASEDATPSTSAKTTATVVTTSSNDELAASSGSQPLPKVEHPGVSALKKQHTVRTPESGNFTASNIGPTPHLYSSTPGSHYNKSRRFNRTIIRRTMSKESDAGVDKEDEALESTFYMRWVVWSCVVSQLWAHPSLLTLLPFPIAYSLLKHFLVDSQWLESAKNRLTEGLIQNTVMPWCSDRCDVLLPGPVRAIASELTKMEKSFLKRLPNFADVIVTVVLILAGIALVVSATIFIASQLYVESFIIVQLSSTVISKLANTTMYQHLNNTLLGGKDAIDMDEVLNSGYLYGRDYVSSSLVSLMSESTDKESVAEFEGKVLELWDRVYQYWLNPSQRNATPAVEGADHQVAFGPVVTAEAITSSMEDLLQGIVGDERNAIIYSVFYHFTVNNMGTLTSVLEHGWALVQGNVKLVLTMITELLRVLVSSGSGMIDFAFSIVVYFTALFYLLGSKNPIYKPVEVISNYGQLLGSGFASALNKAINSVFTVTVKMICFYAMWTYLTHTLFSASIITFPVMAAAFLAAIPVAGQYLVAVPAALELWLAEDRWTAALFLILCHFVPTYVVDVAIYSEIEQGIHPWITGLSIVGGVTGAIYGPLLLCAVYVILSMYTGVLKEIPLDTTRMQPSLIIATPLAKRSESFY